MTPIILLKKEMTKGGGLEKHTLRIIEKFQEKGHFITIISSDASFFEQRFKDVCVIQPPFLKGTGYKKIKAFDLFCSSFLKHKKNSLCLGLDRTSVQTHLRAGNGVHAAYLDLRRKQEGFFKSLSFYLNPLHSLLLKIERESLQNPLLQKVIVNSSLVKSQLLHYYPIDENKIEIVHNGVEWEEFKTPFKESFSKKKEIAKNLQLDPTIPQWLFLGHNFQRKGLKLLLQALSHLKSKPFHLSVVGEDKNLSYYKNLAHSLSLGNKVSFFGRVENTIPFYQLSDMLILPSLYDPFANVTVEALAMGLFVISSKFNGGHEVLSDFSGKSFTSLDCPDELVSLLEQALSYSKNLTSASLIRNSVQSLDFKRQLSRFYKACI